jgi:hypothetical protein
VLSVVLVACAGSGNGTKVQPGVSYDRIEVTKLSDSVATMNAYQIVRLYKPQWLGNTRGRTGYSGASVHVNGSTTSRGGIFSLKSIPAPQVQSIEHLNAVEAQHRLGSSNSEGALVVHTRSGHSPE